MHEKRNMRLFNLMALLVLASMVLAACGGSAPTSAAQPAPIVEASADEPTTLAKMDIPISLTGGIYVPETAQSVLNGMSLDQACSDGSCFKTVKKDLSFFPGDGWYYQESWSIVKGGVVVAQQSLAAKYPQDQQSGLVYVKGLHGNDNPALTVGEAAVYLLSLADISAKNDPTRTGWENFVENLPNDNWSQTNNPDGTITISNPDGNSLTFNTDTAGTGAEPNSTGWENFVGNLPNDNWSQTNNPDGTITICNPSAQCLTFPAPGADTTVSNSLDQPNRSGWSNFVGNLPNNNWTQTNNADGSITICNPGNQCETFTSVENDYVPTATVTTNTNDPAVVTDDSDRTGWVNFIGNLPNNNWTQTNNADGSITICNPGNQCATFWPATIDNGVLPTNTPLPGVTPSNTPEVLPGVLPTNTATLPEPSPTTDLTICPANQVDYNGELAGCGTAPSNNPNDGNDGVVDGNAGSGNDLVWYHWAITKSNGKPGCDQGRFLPNDLNIPVGASSGKCNGN